MRSRDAAARAAVSRGPCRRRWPPRAAVARGSRPHPPQSAEGAAPCLMPRCLKESLEGLWNLWIEQLGEPRVVHHALEVVVDTGLQPVPGVQVDGPGEVLETFLRAPGNRIENRQPIKRVIGR